MAQKFRDIALVKTADEAPPLSPAKLAEKRRLAAALRENLKRRKAQLRQRNAQPAKGTVPAAVLPAQDESLPK